MRNFNIQTEGLRLRNAQKLLELIAQCTGRLTADRECLEGGAIVPIVSREKLLNDIDTRERTLERLWKRYEAYLLTD